MRASQPFLLNQRNADFVAGRTQRSASSAGIGWIGIAFLVPFVLIGFFLIGITLQMGGTWLALHFNGVDTAAVVVDARIDDTGDGDTYYVTCRFSVATSNGDERVYTAEQSVSHDAYQRLSIGSNTSVRYVASNPNVSAVQGQGTTLLFLAGMAGFWNGLLWLMISQIAPALLRDRQLAKQGQQLPGQVVQCSGATDSDGDYSIKLHYGFLSPTGARVTGTDALLRNDLKGQPLPRPADPVVVLYDSDTCHKVL
ncbi:MAG: DUF3592 domain-containing protein [Chloroflexales bacterium]|nr:DUF3592 domain-containing protein [Chloroflexales bacterium]